MTDISPASDPQRLGFDPGRLSRINDWMDRYVSEGKFPGSSVVIARNGEIAHQYCTGLRSIEQNLPYEANTIVRIYSMTKMVTSVGLMMLMEKGDFHLEAPVSRFLPEFDNCMALVPDATSVDQVEPAPAPTVHQLLTHTSGLTYSFNPGLVPQLYLGIKGDFGPDSAGLEAAVKQIAKLPLVFQPGSQWEYSIGIDVLGRLLEVVTGKSLDEYLQEAIFDPLGMVDTGFEVPKSKLNRFADCYEYRENNPLTPVDPANNSIYEEGRVATFSGGGGLVSTLHDYLQFGEMIRKGGITSKGERLLSPRTLAFMRRNHLPGDIASMGPDSFAEMPMEGMGFGLGGAVVLQPSRTRMLGSVGDYGWGGMASTYFWTDPVEDLSVVFFTQLRPSSTYPNRVELKALVHGALTG